jgi:hypothetical protein
MQGESWRVVLARGGGQQYFVNIYHKWIKINVLVDVNSEK